jgi:hypothetical protein
LRISTWSDLFANSTMPPPCLSTSVKITSPACLKKSFRSCRNSQSQLAHHTRFTSTYTIHFSLSENILPATRRRAEVPKQSHDAPSDASRAGGPGEEEVRGGRHSRSRVRGGGHGRHSLVLLPLLLLLQAFAPHKPVEINFSGMETHDCADSNIL